MKLKILTKLVAISLAIASPVILAADKNLSGRLVDPEGQPVAGAQVNIRSLNKTVTSDQQGYFVFTDLAEGRYLLDVEAGNQGHINQSIRHDGSEQVLTVGDHNMEILVVTGNPLEHSSLEMAAPAVVISGDQLVKNRGANIGEALAETPGINLSSFGVGAGRPVIRGQQGNRVTVLSNNSSTQDASNASPDHWIAAEPLLAKRIEVLKGPATLLYGGGAVGGAVNVVDNKIPTELPDGIDGGIELRLGDSATGERATVATITAAKDNIAFHIDGFSSKTDPIEIPNFAESARLRAQEEAEGEVSHEEAVGVLENSDTETYGGNIGFSIISDAGYWGVSYSEFDRNYGLPGHAEHEEEDPLAVEEEVIRLDLKQKRFDLKSQWNKPFTGFQNLKLSVAKTDYQHQEIEGVEIGTTFINDAHEVRLELVHESWSGWQGAFGIQYSESDFAAIGEEAFIPVSNTEKLGVFWLEEHDVGNWHTELGLRFDQQTIEAKALNYQLDKNAFSFAAGAVWHFAEHWSLPMNFASAQRLPAVEELLSNAGNVEADYVPHLATLTVDVGNPNLGKETANNFDLGLRYHTDTIHAEVAIFNNRVDDFIYQQELAEDHSSELDHEHSIPILQFTQQDAVFEGVEAEVNWSFADNGFSYWTAGLFGDYSHAEFANAEGAYIPRQPAKRVGAKLGFVYQDFSAELKAINVAKQDKVATGELATDGYQLVNFDLGYNWYFDDSELLWFLKAQNLLDEEIRDHASFLKDRAPRMGRSLNTGFRLSF